MSATARECTIQLAAEIAVRDGIPALTALFQAAKQLDWRYSRENAPRSELVAAIQKQSIAIGWRIAQEAQRSPTLARWSRESLGKRGFTRQVVQIPKEEHWQRMAELRRVAA